MKTDVNKLLEKHKELNHMEDQKVRSHVQRVRDEWILNTVVLESYEVPFKFKRKKKYQSLKSARVNITYYPTSEMVAGMNMEIMKVVRIKRS